MTPGGKLPNYLGSRPPSVAWLVGKYSSSKCCRKLQLTQAADTPRFMGSAFKLSFARSMDGTFLWARSSSTEASYTFSTLTARWPALTSRFLAPIFPGIFREMTRGVNWHLHSDVFGLTTLHLFGHHWSRACLPDLMRNV